MTITYALMEAIELIQETQPSRAKVVCKATVNKLLTDSKGAVVGVEYTHKGATHTASGPVVIASGGYGADFGPTSFLAKYRPDLVKANLATTNGAHCTGDGIAMAEAIGADLVDMKMVQVHPTGLVDPRDPECKIKWLAAEALRGTGAILLNGEGKRFCNELGHRDYVTGEMNKGKGPYRLVLNSACSAEIIWHCKHYQGRGLMEYYENGAALAKAMGVTPARLQETFDVYSKQCVAAKDEYGKVFFQNGPFKMNDTFYVAVVTPVVHYTMGGLHVNGKSEVIGKNGKPIEGLWCAGEAAG
jgi:succinate dehydrogenase/fumarate reductase flavoprotein subunit